MTTPQAAETSDSVASSLRVTRVMRMLMWMGLEQLTGAGWDWRTVGCGSGCSGASFFAIGPAYCFSRVLLQVINPMDN
jgi:hypothetical protein